ncbi:hypothetical protein GCM10011611_29570 [Aliidongia dinghuensis]|uniref:DUF403 domain-containing protein n=1 Tax=Aliidongia dinghuensis TaxID=1867774 RepID=A0A8J3E3T8_9PROT|nr:circularly permuted type 2 ATP-grasp protein [Aliidongia dinghuensis]GGF21593.1 hypothetical protein GCM10011611_29570 [Aliidongia dinghuensis]
MSTSFLAGYQVPAGTFDEMRGADGTVRPSWAALLEAPDFASAETVESRWRLAERLIRENGVTYNVYGDPKGLARPWPVDPLPVMVPAAEWRRIEAGLAQRARLLDRLLADLYGPQTVLRDGTLPPALVFANPGFLRPCHGMQPPDGVQLHLAAFDLGRRADGTWIVLDDRTQAPSGAGYALENRMVLSRSLPDAFRAQPVERVSIFFRTLRETLARAAAAAAARSRGSSVEPRIVLLTPGPYNETYFEHAYLARYLGYPLVAGEDLTVRYDRVYLKTLGGLQPVDGILRRLDEDFCDPLWLKSDSSLGVAGLVAAARRGHVAILNPLGSGLVEGAGLIPYLPALARRLLGEELLLPQAETRWFGMPGATDDLDQALVGQVVKPAFVGLDASPIHPDHLDADRRKALIERIKAAPHRWALQRHLPLSTVPTWVDGQAVARELVLRAYVAADRDGGHKVMPSGLGRVAPEAGRLMVSMQSGGGSKDVWIVGDRPSEHVSLWQAQPDAVELKRHAADLPSRVADNLYWLGRYAERAEITIRLVRAARQRSLPDLNNPGGPAVAPLRECLASLGFLLAEGPPQPAAIMAGLAQPIEALHRSATTVRDRLSMDTWRVLNALPALGELDQMLQRLAAFNGLVMENMTRGLGWRFLEIGRRLERAYQTLSFVRVLGRAVGPTEPALLEALLEVADSSMTYRARYFMGLKPAGVFDLVLADEANPRAVAFQLNAIGEHIAALPRERHGVRATPEAQATAGMIAALRRADMVKIARGGPDEALGRPKLDKLCQSLTADLAETSDLLSESYFKHAAAEPLIATSQPARA